MCNGKIMLFSTKDFINSFVELGERVLSNKTDFSFISNSTRSPDRRPIRRYYMLM